MAILLHNPRVTLQYVATAYQVGQTREEIQHTIGRMPAYVESGRFNTLVIWRDGRTTFRAVFREGMAIAVHQYTSK
jgi:hypothetical protein